MSCDMREWAAPEKADIIVSELLGSFGDNELSPECLDGAQHFLKGTSNLWCNETLYHVMFEMWKGFMSHCLPRFLASRITFSFPPHVTQMTA